MPFSRLTKYSSLAVFTNFQSNNQKLSRIKFVCISPDVYVQSGERYKICSARRVIKSDLKLFMCAKAKHKKEKR